ncbi:hypothetical protein H0H92_009011, partial [Tricholoma furcatifolium]
MRRRLSKKQLLSGPPPTPSYTPSAGPSRPKYNFAKKQKKLPALVFVSYGQSLLQKTYLPEPSASRPHRPPSPSQDQPQADENPFLDVAPSSQHRSKREKQWERWQALLPSMVSHYMEFKYLSKSMRDLSRQSCTCGEPGRSIDVLIIHFDTIEQISLALCSCTPAPIQLLQRGCFASAPLEPTLAVDLKVLDFVSKLFLNIAPNHTAWSKTVEDFLGQEGYKLKTETPVHCNSRKHLRDDEESEEDEEEGENGPSNTPPQTPVRRNSRKRLRDDEESEEDEEGENGPSNPFPDPRPRSRPSEYLRSRCPLCFGGDFDHSEEADNKGPNAIVCIDACFTQKRNRQERDPPRAHPRTVFVPEHDTNKMEEYVERLRGARSRVHKRHKATPQDDHFEGSLRVPKSVLDGCESGFTAADSRRQKASTQFFDDTALMALLCRHDIVLFIVNMRSAGEKQHYAVVL